MQPGPAAPLLLEPGLPRDLNGSLSDSDAGRRATGCLQIMELEPTPFRGALPRSQLEITPEKLVPAAANAQARPNLYSQAWDWGVREGGELAASTAPGGWLRSLRG